MHIVTNIHAISTPNCLLSRFKRIYEHNSDVKIWCSILQPKPSINIFLKQLTHLSPFPVSLIILSGLPPGNIKNMANQLTCLRTRLEIQLDNIFVSSSLRWLTDGLLKSQRNPRKDWISKSTSSKLYNIKRPPQASQLQKPEANLPLHYFS